MKVTTRGDNLRATGLALSTTGCPEEEVVITNPPPVVDTGDTGETEDAGSKGE